MTDRPPAAWPRLRLGLGCAEPAAGKPEAPGPDLASGWPDLAGGADRPPVITMAPALNASWGCGPRLDSEGAVTGSGPGPGRGWATGRGLWTAQVAEGALNSPSLQ
jgi:hypothetical protein